MTHLVIDSALLDALIAAGDGQHSTLGNTSCWCRHNVPYADCKVKQVVTKECQRCKVRKDWDTAKVAVKTRPPDANELARQLASLLDEATAELFEVTRDPGRPLADTEKVRASIRQRANALVTA